MTVDELMKELRKIKKVHPEAGGSQVWAYSQEDSFRVNYIGFDLKKHFAPRTTLEE